MSTTTDSPSDAAAIIAAAQQAAEPRELDPAKLYAAINGEGGLNVVPLEVFRDAPDRTRGIYCPATVDAFIAYVKAHHDPDSTTVWVHPTAGKVEAIIDDSSKDSPRWRQHRAVLSLIPTPEWEHWKEHDGILMGQQEFAELIEDGLAEIVEPDGAQMLEIAQSLQAKNNVAFHSGYQLTSGEVRMRYEEKIEAQAGQKGDLAVPQVFTLGIAPFIGEDAFRIEARLRFRIGGGNLRLGYKLQQPDLAVRTVLEGIAERVGQEFPSTFLGTAPRPTAAYTLGE